MSDSHDTPLDDALDTALRTLSAPRTLLEDDEPTTTLRLLVGAALCAAVFGAVVGGHRGGLMVPVLALKLPVVLLLSVGLTLPLLRWVVGAAGTPLGWARTGRLGAVLSQRMALVLLGLLPLMWLALSGDVPRWSAVRRVSGLVGIAWLVGTWGVLPMPLGRGLVLRQLVAVALLATLGQLAWVLGPWIGDGGPGLEGSALEAVWRQDTHVLSESF